MSPQFLPAGMPALLLVLFAGGPAVSAQTPPAETASAVRAAAASASTPRRAAAEPTDPAVAVPPLQHRSAFAGYRSLGAAEPLDWRAANERVARIGGWRAYTREALAPAAAASAPAPTPPARPSAPASAARTPNGAHDHGTR